MKIAMLTKHFNFRNGSSVAIHKISNRLISLGHEVHIFCNKNPDPYSGAATIHHVPVIALGSWAQVLSFDRGCRRRIAAESFDIVHGHGNTVEQDVVTVHICRAANRRARGLSVSKRDPHLFLEQQRFLTPRLKSVIVLSDGIRENIRACYGIPFEKMVTIPNGVDSKRFHPGIREVHRKRLRREMSLSEGERIVLFMASGNFKNRGLSNLLSAIKGIPGVALRLVIAGGDRLNPFRSEAARMGIGDRVIFLPFSDRAEELHAAADALIFPSFYDTFGSVPLEAMASGLPVVVSARVGMSELITDGEDGMILKDPDDVDGLVAALRHIMDDSLRERMGRKARETAERQTWDQATDRTLEVYQEIVGGR